MSSQTSTDRVASKLNVFKNFVSDLAKLSTCKRLKVGAIILPPSLTEIWSIGYNGPARTRPNDSCRNEEGTCGCIHAESNAIAKLRVREPSIMICTDSPCEICSGLILNTGSIRLVIYDRLYRRTPRDIPLVQWDEASAAVEFVAQTS